MQETFFSAGRVVFDKVSVEPFGQIKDNYIILIKYKDRSKFSFLMIRQWTIIYFM